MATLHEFDEVTSKWTKRSDAPDPPRGGTVLCPANIGGKDCLLRFGGFAGYEVGSDGAVDVYAIDQDSWKTVVPSPDPKHGLPGARSVHGFVSYSNEKVPGAVALLFHGEKEPSSSGHAGAGSFWADVWLLIYDSSTESFSWRNVPVQGRAPEARGWFGSAALGAAGVSRGAILYGGLLSSNERADDLWALLVE